MSTTKSPYGFRALMPVVGGASGRTRRLPVQNSYGTAFGMGDPVALSAGFIVRPATGDVVMGVAQEFNFIPDSGSFRYPQFARNLAASTSSGGLMFGSNSPLCTFEEAAGNSFMIQADASVTAGQIGMYADVSFGAVDANGQSTTVLKSSTITAIPASVSAGAATNQKMVQILNYVPMEGNSPTDAFPDLEVKFVKTLTNLGPY